MNGQQYLEKLQSEAKHGFHHELRAWVDDKSAVARVLDAMDEETSDDSTV